MFNAILRYMVMKAGKGKYKTKDMNPEEGPESKSMDGMVHFTGNAERHGMTVSEEDAEKTIVKLNEENDKREEKKKEEDEGDEGQEEVEKEEVKETK